MFKLGNPNLILSGNIKSEIERYKRIFNYKNAIFLAELLIQDNENDENKIILAKLYIENNNFEKAYILLNKNIRIEYGKYLNAFCAYKINKLSEAKEILFELKSKNSEFLYLLGLINEELGLMDEALENYKKSLILDNNLWVAYEKILKLEDINKMKSFQNFDKLNPGLLFKNDKFKSNNTNNNEVIQSSSKNINKESYIRNKEKSNTIANGKKININTSKIKNPLTKKINKEELVNTNLLTPYLRNLCKPFFYLENFEINKCLKIIEDLPKNVKDLNIIRLIKSRCYMIIGDNKKAYINFSLIDNSIPLLGLDYYSSCLFLLNKKKELFDMIIKYQSNCLNLPEFWVLMGNYESLNKNSDNCIEFLKRAINIRPKYSYAKCLLALEYYNQDNFDLSEELYKKVLEINPKNYISFWGLGNIYQKKGDFIISKFYFEKALKINEDNPYLNSFLANCYNSLNDINNSIKYYEKANKIKQNDILILKPLCKIYIDASRFEDVKIILRELKRVNPFDPEIYFLLGLTHKKNNNYNQALENFDKCIDLNYDNSNKAKYYIDIIMRNHNKNQIIEDMDDNYF